MRNREQDLQRKRNWYVENREQVLQRQREFYEENREQCRQRARERYAENNESALQRQREYRERHPEKIRAHFVVRDAVRSGRLERESCSICGELKADAHHEDYSKPLDVIWLCRTHHRRLSHRRGALLSLGPAG